MFLCYIATAEQPIAVAAAVYYYLLGVYAGVITPLVYLVKGANDYGDND